MEKKIGIFYGSVTGATEAVSRRLAKMLGVDDADVKDVAKAYPSDVADYDVLVFATSTWRDGDLPAHWADFINGVEVLDLKGKKVAFLGLGDETMTDTFCDAVGKLYERMKGTEATIIGETDADGYTFNHSSADLGNGVYAGLLLDEVNHPEMSDLRLRRWAGMIADA